MGSKSDIKWEEAKLYVFEELTQLRKTTDKVYDELLALKNDLGGKIDEHNEAMVSIQLSLERLKVKDKINTAIFGSAGGAIIAGLVKLFAILTKQP